jgi:hypothetical protein
MDNDPVIEQASEREKTAKDVPEAPKPEFRTALYERPCDSSRACGDDEHWRGGNEGNGEWREYSGRHENNFRQLAPIQAVHVGGVGSAVRGIAFLADAQ